MSDYEQQALELHKALGLEGFENDKAVIESALRRAADEARAEEREACAKIADDVHSLAWAEAHAANLYCINTNADFWGPDVAKRIRARGGAKGGGT